MTALSDTPRAFKGAIVGLDPFNPLASVIVFQYNPEKLTRRVQAKTVQRSWFEQASPGDAMRLAGPPEETISMEVELDAADQLDNGDPIADTLGVTPQLAAIEMLLYPKSALVIANQVLARLGVIEVIPPEAPLTILVFGLTRVLPVRITEMGITEELLDADLNPVQAKVSLGLKVLTYDELGLLSVGGGLFMAHQIAKEVMATIAGVGNIAGAVSGAVSGSASVSVGG